MASERHQELASFIKSVHRTLRLQSKTLGADEAWIQHCQQVQVLEKYAESMKLLATEFWEKRNCESSELCRIQWVVNQSVEYFFNKGYESAVVKEQKLCQKYIGEPTKETYKSIESDSKLKLLDVGSCYNPFSKFPIFDVTAVDIVPATPDVLKCDFLSVEMFNGATVIKDPCVILPKQFFDIVVFSLLLEYLPSSNQRFNCCKNAYELLRPNGVLFILTPDSKHATANSKVMKSWRCALASLGFWRVSYSKLRHLHCMCFRRCTDSRVPQHWLTTQPYKELPENWLYIPQDINQQHSEVSSGDEEPIDRCDSDNKVLADTFSELPDCNIFL